MQRHLPIRSAEGFYTMDSGGLGYGMPAAVGVALAKPGRRVLGIMGDGSSLYSVQALWSAVQWQLPITWVVLNNRRYAALQDFAPVFGFGPDDVVQGTELPNLDFVALARGMGGHGLRVTDPAELANALKSARESPGPTLIEVAVS
jgi:benzoylformate decarboxylase